MCFLYPSTTAQLRRRVRVLAFFFQAEDGIRDIGVTGVQTCALPIYLEDEHWQRGREEDAHVVRGDSQNAALEQDVVRLGGCRLGDEKDAGRAGHGVRDRKSVV